MRPGATNDLLKSSLFTLLALAIVAGCATIADVDKAKASWHGATYDEVVTSWGQPASQTTLKDGLQAYTWISQSAGYGGSVGVKRSQCPGPRSIE